MNKKNAITLIIILFVVIFIASMVYAYYAYYEPEEKETNSNSVVTNINTNANANLNANLNTNTSFETNTNTSTNETADWQTYTNDLYFYSIKYPSSWYVDTEYSENDFNLRGPEPGEYIGGDTIWSNYEDPRQYSLPDVPSDIETVHFLIYKQEGQDPVSQLIDVHNYFYYKKENISVNGVNGVRLHLKDESGNETSKIMILLAGENRVFKFTYGRSAVIAKSIMENMINTFQFTE